MRRAGRRRACNVNADASCVCANIGLLACIHSECTSTAGCTVAAADEQQLHTDVLVWLRIPPTLSSCYNRWRCGCGSFLMPLQVPLQSLHVKPSQTHNNHFAKDSEDHNRA